MASEVVMPQMGAEMQEGTIIRWLKREGDPVSRGEIIAEIETDKANVEIEAFDSGVFRKILAPEGTTVPVGQVIGVIAAPDEEVDGRGAEAPAAAATQAAPGPEPAGPQETVPARPREPEAAGAAANGRVRASPVARRIAEERGIDLRRVRGSGPEGRIVRRDVEELAPASTEPPERPAQAAPSPQAEAPAPPAPTPAGERVEMSRMRQAIARRMSQSKREAPHYYLTMDIDMTEAMRLREQLNAVLPEDGRVSVNDLIVKAAAKALEKHPRFNAWFVDGQVQQQSRLNVCIAVALEDGLIAPALLDVGPKPLPQIARESRDLAERARNGALRSDEFAAGTFTVSNLGMYGIEALIPIIQPPQAAILGVGAVSEAPAVRDGQVVVRQVMKVALAADHRVTDGAEGAQFLASLRSLLENPVSLLV